MKESVWLEYIRMYAEEVGHQIVGELKRCEKKEFDKNYRLYVDEDFNSYWTGGRFVSIMTKCGDII